MSKKAKKCYILKFLIFVPVENFYKDIFWVGGQYTVTEAKKPSLRTGFLRGENMGISISHTDKRSKYPHSLRRFLPEALCAEIDAGAVFEIEEIRLRAGSRVTLTTSRGTVFLRTLLSQKDISEILAEMCGHSLYAYSDMINCGYVTLDGGVRVGVCGRAAVEDGRVIGVYGISSLNIRIPSDVRGIGEGICRLIRGMTGSRGVLIYSPPGVGKTTLLRSVARSMGSGARPWRVAVIDTRGELCCFGDMNGAAIDVLLGYPKGIGIEIAARTMNAQLMVCDEIGEEREISSILYAQNCGVPLLASAHGDSIEGLLRRSGIAELHRAGVFGAYVRISRRDGTREYDYKITTAEEADDILQNNGRARTACVRNSLGISSERQAQG